MRPSLIGKLVRNRRWLGATALGFAGWPLEIVALLLAPLTVVQPCLASGLILLLWLGATRLGEKPGSILRVGPLELDTRARRALRHGEPLVLTAREYALLEHLVLHADAVVGRAAIAEHVWDAPYEAMSNVIDVCIQRLRRKIDDPGRPSLIVTRRGEGYMLSADEDAAIRTS